MSSESKMHAYQNERMRPGDPYYNYCHWPYEPPVDGVGKLRPGVLLFQAVHEMPHSDWVMKALRTLQEGLGDFRCVYGVKRIDGEWALEVYIYDYDREERTVSIERVKAVSDGAIRLPDSVSPAVPYFMFSFDLTPEAAENEGFIDVVNVYVGNPGSTVSSGIAYAYTRHQRELENFYFFFDAAKQEAEIVDKMKCSVQALTPPQLDELFREELSRCHTICLANKRLTDTIYYSGVDIDQFLFFLNWQDYPQDFTRFVESHRDELDHLLFDVGVDYRTDGGVLNIMKHGFYGIF